uniref:Uncharacterized protein n=1 Tax=Actinomadura fulva subsp. indica TaxID=1752060 RepID=A0A1B4Z981_9ACTN|nr:hypothetical protein [Actinomadura fulva subsp. indica]
MRPVVARLNRAVAVGEADGPRAGLAALAELDPALPRHTAAAAYLHERDGDPATAARLYAEAARSAPSLSERDRLTRQAARLNAQLRSCAAGARCRDRPDQPGGVPSRGAPGQALLRPASGWWYELATWWGYWSSRLGRVGM